MEIGGGSCKRFHSPSPEVLCVERPLVRPNLFDLRPFLHVKGSPIISPKLETVPLYDSGDTIDSTTTVAGSSAVGCSLQDPLHSTDSMFALVTLDSKGLSLQVSSPDVAMLRSDVVESMSAPAVDALELIHGILQPITYEPEVQDLRIQRLILSLMFLYLMLHDLRFLFLTLAD